MSRQNVEAVQRGLDAWNRGDLDAMLELVHPDITMLPVIARLVEGKDVVYEGISGVRQFWEDWRNTWDFQIGEVELRDLGDTVLASTRVTVTGSASGINLDSPMAVIFELEDGRLIRMDSYLDPAEALAAVGLQE